MDFDRIIDRRNTASLKWDNPNNKVGKPDIIPLWVADMDFAPPPAVLEALNLRAQHPIFGYTKAGEDHFNAVAAWYRKWKNIDLPIGDIMLAPSVLPSVAAALHAFTKPGEAVIDLTPVYYPLQSLVTENDRVLLRSALLQDSEGKWLIDFAGMEKLAAKAEAEGTKVSALLLSSPHNPVGRVWTREEIEGLLDFAKRRDLAVISDEIHGDIILGSRPFISLATFTGLLARKVIVLSGPNKTFNIAGLHISHVIVRDPQTRQIMKKALGAAGFSDPNIFSLTAATAAYKEGEGWLMELLAYLQSNLTVLQNFLAQKKPEITISDLEGSYLAWLNLRKVLEKRGKGESEADLARLLEEEGRVKLSPGSGYGFEGSGFMRLNLACPRSILEEGLQRMLKTL